MINPWKILIAVAIGVSLFFAGYGKGYFDAKNKYELKELKSFVKEVAKYDKKEREVILLPADELKRRYCQWVRDDKQKCLQANIPISE